MMEVIEALESKKLKKQLNYSIVLEKSSFTISKVSSKLC